MRYNIHPLQYGNPIFRLKGVAALPVFSGWRAITTDTSPFALQPILWIRPQGIDKPYRLCEKHDPSNCIGLRYANSRRTFHALHLTVVGLISSRYPLQVCRKPFKKNPGFQKEKTDKPIIRHTRFLTTLFFLFAAAFIILSKLEILKFKTRLRRQKNDLLIVLAAGHGTLDRVRKLCIR